MRDCCPVCRKPVTQASQTHPFCGERCRLVDLGRWLEGEYRIPDPDLAPGDPQDGTIVSDAGRPDEPIH